ncbi:glucosyltransferase [Parahypoxylon ruwenzoriense]
MTMSPWPDPSFIAKVFRYALVSTRVYTYTKGLTRRALNSTTRLSCSVRDLRLFNAEIISYLALTATVSRVGFEQLELDPRASGTLSPYAAWSGFNIALFPVLFFFSGLYYTDVISTFLVLHAYANHLSRVRQNGTSFVNDVYTVLLGLLALSMRQTNIFWIVVYMGGLELVHGVKALRPDPVVVPMFATLPEQIGFYAWRYSLGDIHDPPLNLAYPIDLLLCVVSIGVAAISNLGTIVGRYIWPHLVVLGTFIAFVAWNGGVVLGDKSNHVATLHLAQMLYIWPLFAFFSAPLFVPWLLNFARLVFQTLTGSTPSATATSRQPPITVKRRSKPTHSAALELFNRLGSGYTAHTILIIMGATLAATLIVRYNTIIHPFTLADNRHYMFYVFRYTILRAPWIRYALVPAYIASAYLCWATLRGNPLPMSRDRWWICTPFRMPEPDARLSPSVFFPPSPSTLPPRTSTVLILLLAAALSLVTAPLVEPRYFILPWVFWRLIVPVPYSGPEPVPYTTLISVPPNQKQQTPPPEDTPRSPGSRLGLGIGLVPQNSPGLVPILETAWFLLINAATMYVFVTRPFYWRDPDGALVDGGRVQRFMW